jgi:hypothetical protein
VRQPNFSDSSTAENLAAQFRAARAQRPGDARHIVISLSEFPARGRAAGCTLAEHQRQQSAEHDAAKKQRPIGGLQGKKPSFANNVRKHRKTRC